MHTTAASRSARQRGIGLISAGLLAAGVAASVPAASAADDTATPQAPTGADALTSYDAGRYVVVLRDPAAATYAGGDRRFAATRAPQGGQFRADSANVRAYTAHLERTQRTVADDAGVEPVLSNTIASNSFVADLSAKQALELAGDRRVLLVEKNEARELDTWNTGDVLGMTGKKGAWKAQGPRPKAGDGVVAGVIDSGYWPESESFSGNAINESPRTKWDITMDAEGNTRMEKLDGGVFTGACEAGEEFEVTLCNDKVIGARYYSDSFEAQIAAGKAEKAEDEFLSPRDGGGHGSHTASTTAGNIVRGVEVEGREFGKLSGMAPAAKIAVYKVCWEDTDPNSGGCYTDAILGAIDDAVADGVDVLNFSISGATDTVVDSVEVAFEGAAEAGIFVAASAGNSGPDASTVAHNSPWLTTVASATHVNFENTLKLGDGTKLVGASISGTRLPQTPLVDSVSVAGTDDLADAALCGAGTLDPALAEGKIVVCDRGAYARVDKSAEVARAGGVGMVMVNPSPNSLDADFHSVPTIHLDEVDGASVYEYLDEAGTEATAAFRLGNKTDKVTPLPQVSGFSSRGPAVANESDILKPDIAAPGSSVLAAVSPPTNAGRDYDLYSGTSMAAPHVAGLGAFLMGTYPTWSPQDVQSAMMTTANRTRTADGKGSDDAHAQGAGIVNPKKFFDPGWHIGSGAREWRGFLTGQGLPTGVPAIPATEVNLPSMAQGQVAGTTSFTRTMVSTMAGTWKVKVRVPGFEASAPTTVTAKRKGDIEDLTIEFTRTDAPLGEFAQGVVTLKGPTKLRLPVALRPVSVKAPLSVEGTGTDGSTTVEITPSTTGELAIGSAGLAQGISADGSVAEGDSVLSDCIEVPEGVDYARFDLDAIDDSSDLDLYVYAADSCDPATIYAYAGQSATGSADERVDITAPEAGAYFFEVDGYAAGSEGSPIEYDFDTFLVGAGADLGDLTVEPNPVPTQAQQPTSFDVSWTGLEEGAEYLGLLTYEGALAPTVLSVSTE